MLAFASFKSTMYLLSEKVRYVVVRPTDQFEHKGKDFTNCVCTSKSLLFVAIRKLFKDAEWFEM
jgi:hypothetical protein